jgi:(S)-2-hydroxyglutarate dehydrogenase
MYYRLRAERRALVNGLIYPVPDPRYPFLGIHLTRTVGGEVLVGPNAVLALNREGYARPTSLRWRDTASTLTWPGTWSMARRHWKTGGSELARSASKRLFIRQARKYVPELSMADVLPAVAGIRAQAVGRHGDLVDDFVITHAGRVVNIRNAPSPAATSSFAIADYVAEHLQGCSV